MKKSKSGEPPLFSILSIVLAVGVLIVLLALLVFQGSAMFNPGPLSSQSMNGLILGNVKSHADLESQCSTCHEPFKNNQGDKCLVCHTEIADQINQENGLHGVLDDVKTCRNCHSDHNGRDFDMIQEALQKFDHNQTDFPLTGEHLLLDCESCHADRNFKISSDCVSCHLEPELHAVMFSTNCVECHNSISWTPANFEDRVFDHENTGFSLVLHESDFQGQAMICMNCHQPETTEIDPNTCKTCHETNDLIFMLEHTQLFGSDCAVCHDGKDRMQDFDHNNFFVLDGAHFTLDCSTCHVDKQFIGTPSECSACHAEPEIHAGSFGLNCTYCHVTDAWLPASLNFHTFPLDHGDEGEIACETCHITTYAEFTCESCHDSSELEFIQTHKEKDVSDIELANCIECHWDGENHD